MVTPILDSIVMQRNIVENNKPASLHDLIEAIRREFDDIADYIWKTPRLIEREYEIEVAKLSAYFPNGGQAAKFRWTRESRKLERVFPFLIATSNLFSVTSIFEVYLLRLAKEVEHTSGFQLKSYRGSGIQRTFSMLKETGMELHKVELWPQINAALTIRNCLMHSSGLLDWSKDEKEIRRVVKANIFLSKDHRQRRRNLDQQVCDEVTIYESELGDRIRTITRGWFAHTIVTFLLNFVDVYWRPILKLKYQCPGQFYLNTTPEGIYS